MKSLYSLLICTFLFSGTLFAESYTRGSKEKMDGIGDIAKETTISLGKGVVDFSGTMREKITLKTPHTTMPQSHLIQDSKRSIVLLDSYDVEALDLKLRDTISNVVSGKDQRLGINLKARTLDDFYIIGNFVHHMILSPSDKQEFIGPPNKQAFFIAIIPKDIVVERIIFQIQWFGDGSGGHNQIRMIMDQPIVLIPQNADVYSPMVLQNENGKADMVYSLQAARVQGGNAEWNAIEGILGEYANALQLFSTEAKAKKQIYNSVVEQYELINLNGAQKRAVFDAARINSDSIEDTSIYNTILNSCVSHSILALRGNRDDQSGQYLGVKNLDTLIFNPYTVISQLKETILDDKSGEKLELRKIETTMNEEFSRFEAYGKILTEKDRQETQAYKVISPIEKTLFSNTETASKIEDLIRKVAIYIIDNEFTYDGMISFIEGAKQISQGELSLAEAFPDTKENQNLYQHIKIAWSMAVEDNPEHPLSELLTLLTTVQTQDLKKASEESR